MRHFRTLEEIVECLVEEHQKQGFVILPAAALGTLAVRKIDDDKLMSINLTVIAQALWEKFS
ncbi:hypothetical protein [Rhizobium sp. 9140]|uniref:hypothetical protein n=1 Tax=Rhizobium sp. 9140 TaxID=1761900 RepID=UPI000793176E|nr:hypothetical protein [Rhizobium sp. 9140]CZT36382.1 hypothetical protein GA0004734_00033810 [Rhizobium sp. 9140]